MTDIQEAVEVHRRATKELADETREAREYVERVAAAVKKTIRETREKLDAK